MANVTVTSADAVLKRLFKPDKVKNLAYQRAPFLAMVPKSNKFGGNALKIPIVHEDPQGGSRTFTTAQSNKGAGAESAFLVTRVKDYGLTSIDLEAIKAAMGDATAFLNLANAKIKGTINMVANNLGTSLYRNTGGARGRVGSTSTTTLTLLNPSDVVNFAVGMVIDSDDGDGTSGAVDGDPRTITAIDRVAGTLTTSANWTGSGNYSNNDYLFRQGDFGLSVAGLDAYLDSSAGALFGMTRTSDVTRLAGVHYNGSGDNLDEALIKAESLVNREGGMPDTILMNHEDARDLRIYLGNRVEYDIVRSPDLATFGFKTAVMQGNSGQLKIVPDRCCPKGIAYVLTLSSWRWYSLGEAPMILEGLGNKFIWDYNGDSVEIRVGYYGNLTCDAPGYNARVTLPS